MPQTMKEDALLPTARTVLRVIDVLLIAAMIATAIILVVVALSPQPQLAQAFATGPAALRPVVLLVIATGIVQLGLARLFVREFRRIVDTVAAQDPFQSQNADRLHRMGWLALAISALVVGVLASDIWVGQYVADIGRVASIPFGGFALALTLFLLARIFRHGAAMREDVASTI